MPERQHPLPPAEEAQLADALERRRKQIDREIADYISDKEKEYRKFEKRLRSEKRDAERQKILQCERELERAEMRRRGSRDQGISTLSNGKGQKSPIASTPTRANGVRFAEPTEIPLESETGYSKVRKGSRSSNNNLPIDGLPVHERELEFQGLFTPSYLPLLSGKHQFSEDSPPRKSTASSQLTALHQTDQRSSSAPSPSDPAPQTVSPPSTPTNILPLSSSDPRTEAMSHRRSSSRSDTSISSLRSSLRDPKQTRSPKRVLFSIDNIVVSPSTSPLSQRRATGQKSAAGSSPADQSIAQPSSGNPADHSVIRSSWQADIPVHSNHKGLLSNVPITGLQPNGNNGRPPNSAAQTAGTPSPSAGGGGDDFEHVGDEDDLFAFDEDIRYKGEGREDEGGGEEEFGDEELEGLGRQLESSPHAGSLPIEIRWPGKRDVRD
ncbi:MAG: hypothetical protein LQ342_004209 [Letrouitia transgressa]|nr:MAG: hypothetical protein LQ342_004209 [Letrouitia transgressa]